LQSSQHPSEESTLQVKRSSRRSKFVVAVDGAGIAHHPGSAALAELADRLGWTRALSMGMAPFRQRRSAHDPGVVLRDLMVSIAEGGDCLADLGALREQPELFGRVASAPTAWRVIDTIKPERLKVLREASGARRGLFMTMAGAADARRGVSDACRLCTLVQRRCAWKTMA
jgi:Transposase DDE domain group 1